MDLKELDNFLELTENNASTLLSSILDNISINNKIKVCDNIYTDTKIDEWAKSKTITRGGSILMEKIIKNPINDLNKLLERQKTNYELFNYQLETLKNTEKDLLWIMTLKKEIDDDMTINLLFPSTYIINNLNYYRVFLDGYHLYKTILMPLSCLIYPLSIIFGPYYYLNKYLKINLSLNKYFTILYELLKVILKPSGDIKKDITKIVSFIIYIVIYIYSVYQTILISYIIYKTREKLLIKIKGLVDFIKTSIIIIKRSKNIWKPYYIFDDNINENDINISLKNLEKINYDISTIYKLWKNDKYKEDIIKILKIIYTLDVINGITKIKKNNNWSLVNYNYNNTKIWGIKNPLLDDNQISNPVDLTKNIIITGVNAGGKTTYIKSIASNIILSQTFGIINAVKGDLLLYDGIITIMRITDEIGKKSYFEAETDFCSKMIDVAEELNKNNKNGLFLLDEPMHSTPPVEGISVAYSIAKYLGNMKNIRILITTHYHKLIELGEKYNDKFINISVNAKKENEKYKFDYKINKGSSKQTIAIELLKKHKLNDEIIESAIEIKKNLCNEDLRNDT
jgi:hypothetical protein